MCISFKVMGVFSYVYINMGVSLNGDTPPKHLKMSIFSRKTHGCWGNPPIWGNPHMFGIIISSSFWDQAFTRKLKSWIYGMEHHGLLGFCQLQLSTMTDQLVIVEGVFPSVKQTTSQRLVQKNARFVSTRFGSLCWGLKSASKAHRSFLGGVRMKLYTMTMYIYIPLHCEGCCTQLHQNPPPKGIWYEMVSQVFP